MAIFRTSKDKENPYVMLNKCFLHDEEISLKLKGFLAFCLSFPDDWKFNIRYLISKCKESKNSIYSTINEGIEHGYIERGQQRKGGKFEPNAYIIYERKKEIQKKSTVSRKPDTEKRDTEKGTLLSNESTNPLYPSDINKEDDEVGECGREYTLCKESLQKVVNEKLPRKARQPAITPISLNSKTRKFEGITQEDISSWRELFPAVNVDQELKKCVEWAMTTHRKDYRRSILSWMANVQKNHTTPYVPAESKPKADTPTEVVEKNKAKAKEWESQFQSMKSQKKNHAPYLSLIARDNDICLQISQGEEKTVSYECSNEEFFKQCQTYLKKISQALT